MCCWVAIERREKEGGSLKDTDSIQSSSEERAGAVVRVTRRRALKQAAAAATLAATAGGGTALAQARLPRWVMVIDTRRCIGCRACTLGCKSEFNVPVGHFRSCVIQKDSGAYPRATRRFTPLLCNHCANPPCVEACPTELTTTTYTAPDGRKMQFEHKKATFQRPDGAVLVNEKECIGCGFCVRDCPYGVRFLDPTREAGAAEGLNAVAKCTFCVHRVDRGVEPSCVQTCLGRARIFGDMNDPDSEVAQLLREHDTRVLLPKEGTDPHVYYIDLRLGLHRKGVEFRDLI